MFLIQGPEELGPRIGAQKYSICNTFSGEKKEKVHVASSTIAFKSNLAS
jgi:hypothetical protein